MLEWSDKLTARLRQDSRLRDVASEAQEGGLRMQVEIDREKAGRLGVSMQAVNDTLYGAFGQRQISTIYSQANQYRVILEAQPRYQQDPARCRSSTSRERRRRRRFPLSTLGTHSSTVVVRRSRLAHQEQFPSVTISFNLAPGRR